MYPSTFHRFSLIQYNVVIELRWRTPKLSLGARIRAHFRNMLLDGVAPTSPAHLVPVRKFEEAVELLERHGIKPAYEVFENLGYEITYKQKERAGTGVG